MVSQLIEALQRVETAITLTGAPDDPINSENFRACVESFHTMNGDVNALMDELKRIDLAPWFSGLICGSEACLNEYYIIAPSSRPKISAALNQGSGSLNASSSGDVTATVEELDMKRSLDRFLPQTKEDCPPGCGCDNPWPFLSNLPSSKKSSKYEERS
jgi:hypothetical protein